MNFILTLIPHQTQIISLVQYTSYSLSSFSHFFQPTNSHLYLLTTPPQKKNHKPHHIFSSDEKENNVILPSFIIINSTSHTEKVQKSCDVSGNILHHTITSIPTTSRERERETKKTLNTFFCKNILAIHKQLQLRNWDSTIKRKILPLSFQTFLFFAWNLKKVQWCKKITRIRSVFFFLLLILLLVDGAQHSQV